jgi:hypothetical protein
MDWGPLTLWNLTRIGNRYAVKVSPTAVYTTVSDTVKDSNVTFEVHVTDSNRLIGYTLEERRTRWKPTRTIRPYVLGLFYSDIDLSGRSPIRKPMKIMYDHQNMRLLSFGRREKDRGYMLIFRGKQTEKL